MPHEKCGAFVGQVTVFEKKCLKCPEYNELSSVDADRLCATFHQVRQQQEDNIHWGGHDQATLCNQENVIDILYNQIVYCNSL